MNNLQKYILEIYLIIFAFIFLIISLIINAELINILTNISLIIYGLIIILLSNKFKIKSLKIPLLIPAIFTVYSNVKPLINKLHSTDMDELLINIDNYLIGIKAPEILVFMQNKFITEYFQISYFLFFIIPIISYLFFRKEGNIDDSYLLIRNVLFGFLFSYLLYLFIPAIGPRFTLYNFNNLSNELPGIYFTEIIRDLINYGGGITNKLIEPSIQVNRDCMPSGHTMITVIVMFISRKLKSNIKYLIYIVGISLIISTIYLRYHYLIDLIMGIIFAIFSLWIEAKAYNLFAKK